MRAFCLFLTAALVLSGCGGAEQPAQTKPVQTVPAVTETVVAAAPVPAALTQSEAPPQDSVEVLRNSMTTEEKVGQLFLVRRDSNTALSDIKTYHPGGFVLFAEDFRGQTPESIRDILQQYQSASPIPLLIAVDEEGGTVNRVSAHTAFRGKPFPSPRDSFATAGMDMVLSMEIEKGYLLSSLGINVNLGPVCDVVTNPKSFMYSRSLGEDPVVTAAFAVGASRQLASFGVGSVLKHFPGYGDNPDTHIGTAEDNRSLEELEKRDLVPFILATRMGCDAIMVSHNTVTAMDPDFPASLSPAVHRYMREDMGFDGVIVTDDLAMGAIRKRYGAGESAVLAVLAGNDLICTTDYARQYGAVLEAVESGRISMEQLNASVERILRWKQSLGLMG